MAIGTFERRRTRRRGRRINRNRRRARNRHTQKSKKQTHTSCKLLNIPKPTTNKRMYCSEYIFLLTCLGCFHCRPLDIGRCSRWCRRSRCAPLPCGSLTERHHTHHTELAEDRSLHQTRGTCVARIICVRGAGLG